MAFSISEFSGQINRRGLAKNNLFALRITLPGGLSFLEQQISTRELTFLCQSVDVPEFSVETTKVKHRGFGPGSSRPIGLDYGPLPSVFMVDGQFAVKRFFHRWMQEIVHYDVEQGYSNELQNGMLPYEFGYKDDYAGTVEVMMFPSNSENLFYTYKFSNAFPISIGNVTTAWENQAEIMLLPVTFSYDQLKVDGTEIGRVSTLSNRSNGLLSYLSSINTFGQSVSGLELPTNIQDAINLYTDVNTIIGAFR